MEFSLIGENILKGLYKNTNQPIEMTVNLTTAHQDKVLNILREGGKITSWFNENVGIWENSLSDQDLNDFPIRNDTIKKLERLGFIKEMLDFPSMGINTWHINKEGKRWLEDNHYPLTQAELPNQPKDNSKSSNIRSTPEWWKDLYTDSNGQCYSDADPGL